MRLTLRRVVAFLLAGAVAGGLVLWSGVIPLGAASGHWTVTSWLLHTTMRRSVKFHAAEEPPEDLVTEARVRRGAGHFETGCSFCHGTPARPRGAVARAMTPEPPDLVPKVPEWEPEELFWIVQHGVKYTGMPAWPARDREDEVWSMVAFLLRLPEMSAQEYRILAFGALAAVPPPAVPARPTGLETCVRCHGLDGRGDPNGAFPRLDIQNAQTLSAALEAYAGGFRSSGIMQAAVSRLTGEELDALAEHYARPQGGVPALPVVEVAPEILARGESIATGGLPDRDVAACEGCHAPREGRGLASFPRLDGQYPGYLSDQLALYANEARRGGGRFADLMTTAAHTLAEADRVAVAAWYATRTP